MRVNVSKASISKTFVNGLKVSPQQRQLSKSNKKSLEFYNLNLDKFNKETLKTVTIQLVVLALTILVKFAILYKFIYIFISFDVFNSLTVLMNDFRLKTFHRKSNKSCNKSSKSNKPSATSSKTFSSPLTPATIILNLKLSPTSSAWSPTSPSSAAASAAFATSAVLFNRSSSKCNNHHRTYNNSSKSNKVFLYYTPRDPRLRIFIKTKHFFNRPQEQQQQQLQEHQSILSNDKRVFKVLFSDFLCNYGELIGGNVVVGHIAKCGSGEYKTSDKNNKTTVKQFINSVKLATSYNRNINKPNREICDNRIEISDNNSVVATAGAAIVTISATILVVILISAVLKEYSKELLKSIKICLSFHNKHQQLEIFNVRTSFKIHESIL